MTIDEEDGNRWVFAWNNLPKYDENGEEIENTVTEEEESVPEGYEVSYGEGKQYAVSGGTITNNHEPETMLVKVTKIWDDDSNRDGKRPESVTITLTGSDQKTYNAVLPGKDNVRDWAAFENAWSTAYSARGGDVIGSDRYQVEIGNDNGANNNNQPADNGNNDPTGAKN